MGCLIVMSDLLIVCVPLHYHLVHETHLGTDCVVRQQLSVLLTSLILSRYIKVLILIMIPFNQYLLRTPRPLHLLFHIARRLQALRPLHLAPPVLLRVLERHHLPQGRVLVLRHLHQLIDLVDLDAANRVH